MVGKDDILTYKNNNDWLCAPPQNAIIYAEPEATWEAIRQPYRTTIKDLVTGTLPEESELTDTLKYIAHCALFEKALLLMTFISLQ